MVEGTSLEFWLRLDEREKLCSPWGELSPQRLRRAYFAAFLFSMVDTWSNALIRPAGHLPPGEGELRSPFIQVHGKSNLAPSTTLAFKRRSV